MQEGVHWLAISLEHECTLGSKKALTAKTFRCDGPRAVRSPYRFLFNLSLSKETRALLSCSERSQYRFSAAIALLINKKN